MCHIDREMYGKGISGSKQGLTQMNCVQRMDVAQRVRQNMNFEIASVRRTEYQLREPDFEG